jgi:dihydropteroate synthase
MSDDEARIVPDEGAGTVVPAAGSGGDATPSRSLPRGVGSGLPGAPRPTRIGPAVFNWGSRTYVMGILNVTPDSFSGDGLMQSARPGRQSQAGPDALTAAVDLARRMVDEGADLLDIGGESTRPGHRPVDPAEELDRVVPVVEAVRRALPGVPISIDTTKPAVAERAVAAGANLVNDVWGVAADASLARTAAALRVPLVLMHNRAEPRYTALLPEIIADLQRAVERALGAGVAWDDLLIDPGFGFGKTPEHNLALLRELASLRLLGRPVVLGTSRKSTLGKVLDLPATGRLEATLATTVLGAAAGVDIVRVHDVQANVRAARMTDAVVRPQATAEGASG